MHTFAEIPKTSRPTKTTKSSSISGASAGRDHDLKSILQLKRTIGTQSVLQLLQSDAEDRNKALTGMTLPDLGNDPSRFLGSPPRKGALQTKLTINESGDEYEQEADRVAERVINTPEPFIQRACSCGGGSPKCNAQQPSQKVSLQTKRVEAGDRGKMTAPPIIHDVLRSPGQPLEAATRTFMETRFGYDFGDVRVHADERAARSAQEIAANAYTVGSRIVFGAGQFNPASGAGDRLLAHELTHVIQQSGAGKPLLQRDEPKGNSKDTPQQSAPAKPVLPGTAYFHIVVRDSGLDLGGGVLVSDLAGAKTTLMRRKVDNPWTLVLSIHASENRLGAQSPPEWQKNAIFYDEAAIKTLFGGDSAFVAWRDQFGPNRVVLYGCQVTAAFEQTIADNLARGGAAPKAKGLGKGCTPLGTTVTFGVTSRRQYDSFPDAEKEKILNEVQAANNVWGYYGGPPVPNDQVLDYLFKGPKPGSWSQVEVTIKQGNDHVSASPPIPYWNRLSNSMYLHLCPNAVGKLPERTIPDLP